MSIARRSAPLKSRRSRSRYRVSAIAIAAAFTVLATSNAARAASSSGLEAFAKPMADEELSDMRGKFVGPAGVAYFGVELQSSWTNADGVTVAAILAFSLDLRQTSGDMRSAVPLLLVGWSRDCEGCSDGLIASGPGTAAAEVPTLATGGLSSVHGTVQSQQIQGSDNSVRNTLTIALKPANDVQPTHYSGLTPATSSSSQVLPDGGAVHFTISGSQLGLMLENGAGAGLVGQSVDSSLNQVSQNVLLTSNMNAVQNSVALTVGIDQLRQADQFNVQNAISAMKGSGY